jgi:acetyl esterase/lipase
VNHVTLLATAFFSKLCGMPSAVTDSSCQTVAYGPSPDQVGDLYLPMARRAPVICLLHGGFWRMPYGRDHIAPLAMELQTLGFAVWNLEYRRVGAPGGGWPGTLEDVGRGIDHLAQLAAQGDALDLSRLTAVGHSAGGHLALWSAAACNGAHSALLPARVKPAAAVGLAPVADLRLAYDARCGDGAVERLLGGSPMEVPQRYRIASPAERLPTGVKQLLIHGTGDEDVPVDISRRYARDARAAGDDVDFIELATASHMDLVDTRSSAAHLLFAWLAARTVRA